MRDRDFVIYAMASLFVLGASLLFGTCEVHAQPAAPVTALEAGDTAPFRGMLLLDEDLLAWRREIERLRFEVQLVDQRCEALRSADDELDLARATAAAERQALQDRLWSERVADLIRDRDAAREREGPRWWQRGALWLPIGLVVGLVTGIVVIARH
jgi:hypothetical protein